MIATMRHSAFAWSCAVAISAAALSARFDFGPLFLAALAFLIAAAVFWSVRWCARRLARSLPADAIPGIAILKACAWLGVLALWLWTAAFLVPAMTLVYPEPAMNRAYAESLGIELGPLLFTALGVCIAVTLLAIAGIRALGNRDPQGSASLRAICVAAPLACLLVAIAPAVYLPDWKSAWQEFGADLPTPTLLYLATNAYWGVLPALALALCALAWAGRSRARLFTRSVAAQLILCLLCSGLLTWAVAAAWLPLFKLCGAV